MDPFVSGADLFGPGLLVATAWVVLAGLVGLLAQRRGYNPFVWFLFSLVATPVAGLVLLALITPSQGPRPPD